jgi:hypothetical protein
MDVITERPIRAKRNASNCRWATPTLFLSAPLWFDAEKCPWACLRDAVPGVLSTTDLCASCSRWEARTSAVLPRIPNHKREPAAYDAGRP